MPTFAVAHLHRVNMGQEIIEYLERIDATLEPFGGRFVVHGGEVELLEGSWQGHLVIIEFPDREKARDLVQIGCLPGYLFAPHAKL